MAYKVKQPTTKSYKWGKPPHGHSGVSPLCQGSGNEAHKDVVNVRFAFQFNVSATKMNISHSHHSPLQKCPARDKAMQLSRESKLVCSRWASCISAFYNVTGSRRCVVIIAWHSSAQREGTSWPFPVPGCHINSAPTSHPGTAMRVSPRTAEVNEWMR